ncbi:class I SAM-dependent methyltransferase [Nocardioides euryhalodurans]|uniref:class I SAM-dependent methyltransferase n=1 Tax=Nocardioides euryhalodurans TaxID=2518370 RepID=UPI001FC9CE67|nr:class I SAM-dependent methyltransferase [Nocardioides euryhalodurans]
MIGKGEEGDHLRLDSEKVSKFFERRAARIPELGATRAVIYQDRHPDLAEKRDAYERRVLTPRLELDGSQRLLDVGCGTGRWTSTISSKVASYHGIDFAPGLVEHAAAEHGQPPRVRFSVADASDFSLDSLGEHEPFDRVLVSGVFIYLNDDGLDSALRCIAGATVDGALVLLREPVAQGDRLTLVDHHSEELDADYHAVYRTRAELLGAIEAAGGVPGFTLRGHGYVYDDPDLNNRRETQQEWFLLSTGTGAA